MSRKDRQEAAKKNQEATAQLSDSTLNTSLNDVKPAEPEPELELETKSESESESEPIAERTPEQQEAMDSFKGITDPEPKAVAEPKATETAKPQGNPEKVVTVFGKTFPSKSSAIRFYRCGDEANKVDRGKLAKEMGIKYQHVHNVENQVLKRGPQNPAAPVAETEGDAQSQAQTQE